MEAKLAIEYWGISLEQMAWRKSQRYLIERSHQHAKDELGWDEFQARKYRAWEHHLALTILAAWLIKKPVSIGNSASSKIQRFSKSMKWRFCHNDQLVMCENYCALSNFLLRNVSNKTPRKQDICHLTIDLPGCMNPVLRKFVCFLLAL